MKDARRNGNATILLADALEFIHRFLCGKVPLYFRKFPYENVASAHAALKI